MLKIIDVEYASHNTDKINNISLMRFFYFGIRNLSRGSKFKKTLALSQKIMH